MGGGQVDPVADGVVPRPPRRSRADLEVADRRIIELLGGNGRLSNRALAGATGLTEATVAARIRALSARHVLGVTAVLDWQAAGYEWDIWVEVEVAGRSLAATGADLAALDAVHSVQVTFGPVDLLVHALLPTRRDAVRFVADVVGAVPGVGGVRPSVTLDTVKYSVGHARVPVPPEALSCPAPVVPLDGLDEAVIAALVGDGRRSNREIARALEVSEGTVRARLGRMERAGLLRIVGQSDPYLAGTVSAWAYTMVTVEGGRTRAVAERVAALPEADIVAIVAGRHDVLVLLAAESRAQLLDLVAGVRSVGGVRATQTWEVVQTLGLKLHWARLL